jgi:hypothetical protein
LRSISNNAKERPIVALGERVYESTKLAALFDILLDQGCPAGEIPKSVDLTVDEVHSPKPRISPRGTNRAAVSRCSAINSRPDATAESKYGHV